MLNCEFSYLFYIMPNGHATRCTQVLKYGRRLGRRLWSSASPQLLQVSTFIAECGYHIEQCLSTEREHGNAENRFAIVVREHSDTRTDEDVDDRPIVGHLPREISQLSPRCTTYQHRL